MYLWPSSLRVQWKPLCLIIYSKSLAFPSHSSRSSLSLGDCMWKLVSLKWQTAREECDRIAGDLDHEWYFIKLWGKIVRSNPPGRCLKRLAIPSGWDASPLEDYPPAFFSPAPIHTPWWLEVLWEYLAISQEHVTVTSSRIRTRATSDSQSSTLDIDVEWKKLTSSP